MHSSHGYCKTAKHNRSDAGNRLHASGTRGPEKALPAPLLWPSGISPQMHPLKTGVGGLKQRRCLCTR
jgi:hypothetical protein